MKQIQINVNDRKSIINKNIYGHFSEHLGRCIYNGLFVGENSDIPNTKGMRNDVVQALKHIKVPVLRWPGGCFADEYHWKDGIGPKENRKKMINTHWGGVVEDNSFGTHEFMELCAQIGCEPYINGNVGSGTVQEMSEWVEYLTSDDELSPMSELRRKNGQEKAWKVKYWGVGNENWGCGGNMRPEFYADLYRQFQTYVRNYSGNKIYKIACGANDFNFDWTDKVMQIAGRYMHAITLHYYTLPTGQWHDKGSATDFNEEMYYTTLHRALRMDGLIDGHIQIMNRHDPHRRIDLIVDEWGSWYNVEPGTNPGFLFQQSTMRDAMLAALTFNIFHKHSHRVTMTNIAQTVNVLQSVILTEGSEMVLTPTYHAFDMYKDHMDATHVYSHADTAPIAESGEQAVPEVSVTASVDEKDVLTISLVNPAISESRPLKIDLTGMTAKNVTGKVLVGAYNDKNDFGQTPKVQVQDFTGTTILPDGLMLTMPACSIITLRVEK